MAVILRFLRDLTRLHIGQIGVHRWTSWRERTWCRHCGKEARRRR